MLTRVRVVVDYTDTMSAYSTTTPTNFFLTNFCEYIYTKTNNSAKLFLPVIWGPGWISYKKVSKISWHFPITQKKMFYKLNCYYKNSRKNYYLYSIWIVVYFCSVADATKNASSLRILLENNIVFSFCMKSTLFVIML